MSKNSISRCIIFLIILLLFQYSMAQMFCMHKNKLCCQSMDQHSSWPYLHLVTCINSHNTYSTFILVINATFSMLMLLSMLGLPIMSEVLIQQRISFQGPGLWNEVKNNLLMNFQIPSSKIIYETYNTKIQI